MAWMIPYDRMDREQMYFVNEEIKKSGNIWVKGFAGSGKSVLIVHAIRKKLQEEPNAKMCMVVFTRSLVDMFKTGMKSLNLQSIPVMTPQGFLNSNSSYDYVFCDEVQDLSESQLIAIRNRGTNIIVAGDSNQSIYDNKVSPNQIGEILNSRNTELTGIYRLTNEIIKVVNILIPSAEIFRAKVNKTGDSIQIRLAKANDRNDEVNYIWQQASKATSEGESSVVLLPTSGDVIDFANRLNEIHDKPSWSYQENRYQKPDYSSLNTHFLNQKLKVEYIGNGYGSFENAERERNLILMTYHSAKGMEFDHVFIPYMSESTTISRRNENTLLMVAITRSKKNLHLTYSEFLHHLVESFQSICGRVDTSVQFKSSDDSDSDFDF